MIMVQSSHLHGISHRYAGWKRHSMREMISISMAINRVSLLGTQADSGEHREKEHKETLAVNVLIGWFGRHHLADFGQHHNALTFENLPCST